MALNSDRFSQEIFFREIEATRLRAQALVSGLTPQQLIKRTHPGKWSIAECLVHLNVTATVMQSLMEKAIARGKRDKTLGTGPFDIGVKGRFLVWFAEPPTKIRIPAPRNIRPPARIDNPAKILPEFLKAQDGWERLMRESEGLDQARIKLGSLTSLFRARLSAAVPWMLAHQRRHLLQAEKVKQQILSTTPRASAQAV